MLFARWKFSRRFVAGVVILLAMTALPLRAEAQPHADAARIKGKDFKRVFATTFNNLVEGLRETRCVGKLEGKSLDLTFIGIPQGNPYLSQNQQQAINSAAQEAIRQHYGQYYNISFSQIIGASALFYQMPPEKMNAALKHHMKEAQLLLLMHTQRPFRDIVQLEINIFAQAEGASFCNRHETLYLHLPSHQVIIPTRLDDAQKGQEGEYIDNSKAYSYGLRKIMDDFKDMKMLSLLPDFDNPASCPWHGREARLFLDQYFSMKREKNGQFNGERKAWPLLRRLPARHGDKGRNLPAPPPENLLELRWNRPDKKGQVVQFTLSLYQKGLLLNTASYFMVGEQNRYKNCMPAVAPKKKTTLAKKKPLQKKTPPQKAPGKTKLTQKTKTPDKKTAIKPAAPKVVPAKVVKTSRPQTEKLRIKVTPFKWHYRLGDKLRFTVSTNRACELNIVYKQADDSLVLLPYYYNGKPLVGENFLKAGETRTIPVDSTLNMDIKGTTGREHLFVQCKEGGLGKSRVDQNYIDRMNNGKSRGLGFSASKDDRKESDKYDRKTIDFLVEK